MSAVAPCSGHPRPQTLGFRAPVFLIYVLHLRQNKGPHFRVADRALFLKSATDFLSCLQHVRREALYFLNKAYSYTSFSGSKNSLCYAVWYGNRYVNVSCNLQVKPNPGYQSNIFSNFQLQLQLPNVQE